MNDDTDRKIRQLEDRIRELETRLAAVERQAKATDQLIADKLRQWDPRNR